MGKEGEGLSLDGTWTFGRDVFSVKEDYESL